MCIGWLNEKSLYFQRIFLSFTYFYIFGPRGCKQGHVTLFILCISYENKGLSDLKGKYPFQQVSTLFCCP